MRRFDDCDLMKMTDSMRWMVSGVLVAAGAVLMMSGCEEKKEKPMMAKMEVPATGGVVVSNYPLAYFAETLLAGAIQVTFDAPGDEDPAFWQPDDAALGRFQAAKVILLNGAGFSKWVEQVSLPESRVVDTSALFEANLIEVKEAVSHSHGPEGEHAHTGTAFTTWIDLDQAVKQLEAVKVALVSRVKAEERAGVEERAEVLRGKLLALDARALEAGKKLGGRALLGSHPVYQYLARRYQLNLREVHWEPDQVPGKEAVEELDGILKEHPATVMLWEGEPIEASEALLKEKGIASAVFDPCGNRPESGDFLSVMEANVVNLEALAK